MAGVVIKGIGSYTPPTILSNEDLEQIVETSDEWITTRTGIKRRHIALPDQNTSDMAYEAAKKAIEDANLDPKDIQAVILATTTPDMIMPTTANLIKHRLGIVDGPAFDFYAACSGLVYGLSIAKGFILSGQAKHVLLVASEMLTRFTDWFDRNTCVLFGDGAAAMVLSFSETENDIIDVYLNADSSEWQILSIPAGGSMRPTSHETVDNKEHYIKMEGRAVYRWAVAKMTEALKIVMERNNISSDQLNWLVPHQANLRIMTSVARSLGIPIEKVYVNIHEYGNTSAASIGIALDEMYHKGILKKNMIIGATTLGGGLTWGAALIKWSK